MIIFSDYSEQMNLKETSRNPSYLPVAWEYREVIEGEIEKKTQGKIFYFCSDEGICEAEGIVLRMEEEKIRGCLLR